MPLVLKNLFALVPRLLSCGAACAFLAILSQAQAALEADIVTSRGTVTVQLEYVKTPKAVANFITLAQGSRAWVDSRNGAVKQEPFFAGLSFHAVENTGDSKLAWSGSRTGNGTDDPGYTFQDEFDASLDHDPYVIAMASNGPNTNGSRFYLTGNLEMAGRNNRNVVFGKIPSAGSRTVVDQILSAGAGATTITSIAIRRTDPAAIAFDPTAVGLPVVSPLSPALIVERNWSTNIIYPRTAATVLRAYSSTDLQAWGPHFRSFVGLGDSFPAPIQTIDNAAAQRRFYHFSLTTYPAAGGAATFASRIFTVEAEGFGEIVYEFNAEGNGGSYINTPGPGFPPFIGTFTIRPEIAPYYDGYAFRLLVQVSNMGGAKFNLIRGGFDQIVTGKVTGRNLTALWTSEMDLIFEDQGSLELTRP